MLHVATVFSYLIPVLCPRLDFVSPLINNFDIRPTDTNFSVKAMPGLSPNQHGCFVCNPNVFEEPKDGSNIPGSLCVITTILNGNLFPANLESKKDSLPITKNVQGMVVSWLVDSLEVLSIKDGIMIKTIPVGPWQNTNLPNDVYSAVIEKLEESMYKGDENNRKLEIVLWLPTEEVCFVTCLYFPEGYSKAAQKRLWHLCQALGVEQQKLIHNPESAVGRKLRVEIHQVYSSTANFGNPYCDVKCFLPPEKQELEAETARIGVTLDW